MMKSPKVKQWREGFMSYISRTRQFFLMVLCIEQQIYFFLYFNTFILKISDRNFLIVFCFIVVFCNSCVKIKKGCVKETSQITRANRRVKPPNT